MAASNIPALTHKDEIVIGSGKVYFDRRDGNGQLTGRIYTGDSTGFSMTSESEGLTVFKGDGAIAKKLVDIVRQLSYSATFTTHNMSKENWSMWLGGKTPVDVEQSAVAVVDEEITVNPDRYYALGDGDVLIKVSDAGVTVKTSADVDIPSDNNWMLDLENGMIYIIKGGAIAAGNSIKLSYTPVERKVEVINVEEPVIVEGELLYLEDDSSTKNGRNIFFPRVRISASGETQLKSRDNEQSLVFSILVNSRDSDGKTMIISGVSA